MSAAVLLVNAKNPHNVGGAIRACSVFDVPVLRWTGKRITEAEGRRMAGSTERKDRLPREERMKDFSHVDWREALDAKPVTEFVLKGFVPVAVECLDGVELLSQFVHPEQALYVFGPEDGTLGAGWLAACHRFVRIPSASRTPLNLSAAVNVVLYDRYVKRL